MFYATGRASLAAQVACPDSLYRSHSREGFVPRLVNGRPVKAWNQWYNKRMKELKKQLPKEEREPGDEANGTHHQHAQPSDSTLLSSISWNYSGRKGKCR